MKVTPEVVGKDAKVEVEVFVKNVKETQKLVYTLKDAEGNVVAEKETPASETVASFEIENVHLWHGKKTHIYTLQKFV
ncbi:MAG: hypothetical protein ACLTK8_03285 [Paeniclostridium sp.]